MADTERAEITGPKLIGYTGTILSKVENVSGEYNRLNGLKSTLQAAWYIRRVRIIWFL